MKTNTLSRIVEQLNGLEDCQDFFRLFDMVDSGRVCLYRKDPRELEEWAGKLVSLLSRIVSIVFDPTVITDREESVKRVETAGPLSSEDFRRTVREPSFWREGRDGMVPQLVYSREKIDTDVTYENRFVCMLIRLVSREFEGLCRLAGRRENSLLDLSRSRRLDFGPTGLFSRFGSFDAPYVDTRERVSLSEKAVGLLKRGTRMLKRLTASQFYLELSTFPIKGEIRPTNVLIHHPLYSYCYRFYIQELRERNGLEKEEKGYRAFVLLSLLLSLREEGFELTPSGFWIHSGEIFFRHIKARKGRLELYIYPQGWDLSLKSVYLAEDGSPLMTAERLLWVRPYADEKDFARLFAEIRSGGCDDGALVDLSVPREEKDADHVLTLAPGLLLSKESLSNYLRSLFLLLREKGGFDYRCPVCGNDRLTKEDGGYYCPGCHSRFSLVKEGADDIVWIKGLWRSR